MNNYLELFDSVACEKSEICELSPVLHTRVSKACAGLSITVEQFLTIINGEDREAISNGEFTQQTLRAYARSFSDGLTSGRIVLHPSTGVLVKHGLKP